MADYKFTVDFDCQHCGCLTPAIARIPDNTPADRAIALDAECAHCGEELGIATTMNAMRKSSWAKECGDG